LKINGPFVSKSGCNAGVRRRHRIRDRAGLAGAARKRHLCTVSAARRGAVPASI